MSNKGVINFSAAESTFSQVVSDLPYVQPEICELFADESTPIPFHIRTGQQTLGDIAERKRFKYIEFHGYGVNPGTLRARIYIDGIYICDGLVSLSENPDKRRRVNIPIGKQIGYSIDVEIAGCANLRAIEFTVEGMHSQS